MDESLFPYFIVKRRYCWIKRINEDSVEQK